MMKNILLSICLLLYCSSQGQQNCNIYKWDDNMPCYEACELYNNNNNGQGSKRSQEVYDEILEICPGYDDAVWAKSIPYLKRGDFITWKKMIDQAVEMAPDKHLGYRAWCRYQFLRDYEGALRDFEQLDTLINGDIGYCQNGDYHLSIAWALCHKGVGEYEKAIEIIEKRISEPDVHIGFYDFLHLGVCYLETEDFAQAKKAFEQQIKINSDVAENYYYMALAEKGLGNLQAHKKNINMAREYYEKDYRRYDPYTQPMDKIHLKDIVKELDGTKMG